MNVPLFGWLQHRFPIETIIVAKRNNNYKVVHDKMRRVLDKDSGHEYYRFKNSKGEYTPLPYDDILSSDKGNTAFLFSPASGQFFMMRVIEPMEDKEVLIPKTVDGKIVTESVMVKIPTIQPVDERIRQTSTVLHHRIDMRFPRGKSFMEKYGAMILIIIWAIAIVIPMIFYPTFLAAVTDKLGGITGQINQILTQMGSISGQLATTSHAAAPAVKPPV